MNVPKLKIRIKLEIEKAEESLKATKVLFNSELYDESVSSAYYAMFHMARAILLSIDKEPVSHHGLITLFGLEFIKPKLIDEVYNNMLIDAKESREAGDYDAARKFTKDEAAEKMENAIKFNQHIFDYLKGKALV